MSDAVNGEDEALLGTVLAGRYRVERLLGSGGMGAVYLAEHVLMKKVVAVKVLHRELTVHAEIVARFEREAVAAARIDHPNVAAAMDFGRLEDGSFYLALEYVGGHSLRELLWSGPLDSPRALSIAQQIGEALMAAHAAGVVHRDLKPENVMLVTDADNHDSVKVLDFGIAKVTDVAEPTESGRNLTRIGTVMGTPGYMAPEQALGLAVDHRADLYSLGVVLYEMLSGRRPFEAAEPAQILAKQLTEAVAPLPEGVSSELSVLITSLLANKLDDRLQTALDVSLELARLRAGYLAPESGPSSAVVSGRTAPLATAATTLDLASGIAPLGPTHSRRTLVLIAMGALLVVIGAGVVLGRKTGDAARPSADEHLAATALPSGSVTPPAPTPVLLAPEPATRASSLPLPDVVPSASAAPDSSTRVTTTESVHKETDGTTVTRRTTRRTTVSEQHTERHTRRHTGPGGIYIPPPSQWFK